jgi:membrane associated rhomboid family serine protease
MFGDNVEDVLGRLLFIISYGICSFGATGLHYLFNITSNIPCVGASGAISGIVGLYMVLFPYAHVDIAFYLKEMVSTIDPVRLRRGRFI